MLRNYKDIIVWIKLDKSYFNLRDDIIIGNVYLYPQGSTCIEEDQFALLLSEISSLPYQGPKYFVAISTHVQVHCVTILRITPQDAMVTYRHY